MGVLRWTITGMALAVSVLAIAVSWITQTRYQAVRTELDQHLSLIKGVVDMQDRQNGIDSQLIATDRSLANILVGRRAKSRLLASNR